MPACLARSITSLVLLAAPAGLAAQRSVNDEGFVVCLGEDTLAVERYRRTPERLESEIVLRVPAARRVSYTATLDPGGRVQGMELSITPLVHGSPTPRVTWGRLRFRGDTADVLLAMGDSNHALKVAARPGSVPLAAFSHALVEQAILRAANLGRDSMAFDWVGVGAPVAYPAYVTRRDTGLVAVGFFDAPAMATTDGHGHLLALDARATTAKVEVRRVASPDLERFARTFAAEEEVHGPVGQLSPRDTTWAEIGPAQLMVDYGRPKKRGRVVFGGVVPWDRVWRTGANAATQFSTDTPLLVGGQWIPAGRYSLWSIPSPDSAILIFNARSGQWGTDYDPALDVARVRLTRETMPVPVERFTIGIEPVASGGILRLSWDRTSYSTPFTLALE